MANIFKSIELSAPKRNSFDLTHDVKMSGNMGDLMPCMVLEVVPGDIINVAHESMARCAPMIAPPMHRMDQTIHTFFTPNRLLWDGWETFITGANLAKNQPERVLPYVSFFGSTAASTGRLNEYMGLPRMASGDALSYANALPFSAYQLIYNEYYRPQQFVDPVNYKLSDGQQVVATDLLQLRKRSWEHDYFTSALPQAQMGQQVALPLGDVRLKTTGATAQGFPHFQDVGGVTPTDGIRSQGTTPARITRDGNPSDPNGLLFDPNGSLEVGNTTINDLRRAYKLQEWLERAARSGTRYVENIQAFFGVKPEDHRLNRPEYICGLKTPIQISEVLNTTGTATLPQGNMAGHGISLGAGNAGKYVVKEHGYIISILSIMPKPAYMQSIPKHFLKNDRYDYFWPQFAHIGEQPIENREVYFKHTDPTGIFGYTPRYAEYKFEHNRVAGDMAGSLEYWHLARKFANDPQLNKTFLECVPDEGRIFAVNPSTSDPFIIQVLNKVRAIRPMPVFGSPSF